MPSPSSRIRPIIDWVLEQALTEFQVGEVLNELAIKLRQAGIGIYRIQISHRILHPLYNGAGLTWRQGQGTTAETYTRSDSEAENWLQSPLRYMLENEVACLSYRMLEGEGLQFPIIEQLQSEGVTAYLAIMTPFGDLNSAFQNQDGVLMSWSTRNPMGWTDQDIADIQHIQSRFAVVFRIEVRETLAHNVVSAYLGPGAGGRVLKGQIARGDGEDIDAVVYFADLRSSTRLAEELGKDRFLTLLNEFFECAAQPIQESGGEILNYIGDSVLAIFPYDRFGGSAAACQAALAAARRVGHLIARRNNGRVDKDQPAIGFGIGMHPGRVMFGNIGIPTRLAFSVTGSAVNEAARITDLCRELREEIVVSSDFRDIAGGNWRDKGSHSLRNVKQPVSLYAPG